MATEPPVWRRRHSVGGALDGRLDQRAGRPASSEKEHGSRPADGDPAGSTVHASGAVGHTVQLTGEYVAGRDVIVHQYLTDLASTVAHPFQLPPDLPDFVDRSALLTELRGLLLGAVADAASPAVGLCGISGVGKTSFAVRLGHSVRDGFPDGQLYVELRGDASIDPFDVVDDMLRALGVGGSAIPHTLRERTAMYRSRLTGQRVLVLIDDAASGEQVRPLLPSAPGCAVVITSRSRLGGLDGVRWRQLPVLELADSVRLLAAEAGETRVQAELESAQAIVRMCGHLPLALRIAGAKLGMRDKLRVGDLARRLTDERRRLTELTIGNLDVRGPMVLSYATLDDSDRRLFRFLGILGSLSFAPWVAAGLVGGSLWDAEEALTRLESAQLIEHAGNDEAGQCRYRLHDLVRVFARERLEEEERSDGREGVLERLLDTALTLWGRAAGRIELSGTWIGMGDRSVEQDAIDLATDLDTEDCLPWLKSERVVFNALGVLAYEHERWSRVWRLSSMVSEFLACQGFWDEWEQAQQRALSAARRDESSLEEAYALGSLADLNRLRCRYDEALAQLAASLAVFERAEVPRAHAHALRLVGVVERERGHLDAASPYLNQAAEMFAEIGDQHWLGTVSHEIGIVHVKRGEADEAVAALSRSAAIFSRLGEHRAQSLSNHELGIMYREQGRFDQALTSFTEALPRLRDCGDRSSQAWCLHETGIVHRECGRFSEALAAHQESREIFTNVRSPRGQAYSFLETGSVYFDVGQLGDCLSVASRAMALFLEIGEDFGRGYALYQLGAAHRRFGHYRLARAHLADSLALFRRGGVRRGQAYALREFALIHHDQGRSERALVMLDRALSAFREIDDSYGVARTLLAIGSVPSADHDEERRVLDEAVRIFRELHVPGGEAETLRRIGLLHHRDGADPSALKNLRRSLAMFRALDDHAGQRRVLTDLVEILRQAGGHQDVQTATSQLEAFGAGPYLPLVDH
jgi:tetratricopeptide (TPR) repeat protein